jgi:hypothetical protein
VKSHIRAAHVTKSFLNWEIRRIMKRFILRGKISLIQTKAKIRFKRKAHFSLANTAIKLINKKTMSKFTRGFIQVKSHTPAAYVTKSSQAKTQ